jgi:hypothetical protein
MGMRHGYLFLSCFLLLTGIGAHHADALTFKKDGSVVQKDGQVVQEAAEPESPSQSLELRSAPTKEVTPP